MFETLVPVATSSTDDTFRSTSVQEKAPNKDGVLRTLVPVSLEIIHFNPIVSRDHRGVSRPPGYKHTRQERGFNDSISV